MLFNKTDYKYPPPNHHGLNLGCTPIYSINLPINDTDSTEQPKSRFRGDKEGHMKPQHPRTSLNFSRV
jgi:hypothetical protein